MSMSSLRRSAPVPTPIEVVSAALLGLVVMLVVDAFTNELDASFYSWDFAHYVHMAQQGLFDNDHMSAPFCYRYGSTLPVTALIWLTGISTKAGFTVVACCGVLGTLLFGYVFLRREGFAHQIGMTGVLVLGLSHFHLKFLMFDVYRPDNLAYVLFGVAVILARQRQVLSLAAVTVIGLQVREFLIVPALSYLTVEALLLHRDRDEADTWRRLPALIGLMVAIFLAVLIPRLIIEPIYSEQTISPAEPQTLIKLVTLPLDFRKNLNIILATTLYFLPCVLLWTPGRGREVLNTLRPERTFWEGFTIWMLLLTVYGGTDYSRFVTYFFPVLLLVFASLARSTANQIEIPVALGIMAWMNKIFLPVPIWDVDAYLAFNLPWNDQLSGETFQILASMVAAVVFMRIMRRVIGGGGWDATRGVRGSQQVSS